MTRNVETNIVAPIKKISHFRRHSICAYSAMERGLKLAIFLSSPFIELSGHLEHEFSRQVKAPESILEH
jgi:hypothetical protein